MEINRIVSYYHGDSTDEPLDTFLRTNDPLPPRSYAFQPIFEKFYETEMPRHRSSGLSYAEYIALPGHHINALQINDLSGETEVNKTYYKQLEYPNILDRVRSYRTGAPTPSALPAITPIITASTNNNSNNNNENNSNNNNENNSNNAQPIVQVTNTSSSSQQSLQQLTVAELLLENPKLLQELDEKNVRYFKKQYKNFAAKGGHRHPSAFIALDVINSLIFRERLDYIGRQFYPENHKFLKHEFIMNFRPSDTAEYVKQAKPMDLEAAKDLAVSHSGHHVSRCNNYP
jgi:hypothetical protein